MVDPTDVLTGAAIVAAVVSEAGKKLVTPVAETLGLALSDLAGIYRFYQNQNLGKIFTRWAEDRGDKPPLTEEEIQKVLPLLPLASVQSDEDLQQRWASLLEYTVASPGDSLPSFGQTLSQLSPEEARFLDRLMALVSEPKPQPEPDEFVPPHPKPDTAGREPVSRSALLNVFDPSIKSPYTGTWPARGTDMEHHVLRAESENRAKIDRAELLFQDLERLGILIQDQLPETDGYMEVPYRIGPITVDASISGKRIALHHSQIKFRTQYAFSPYGVRFVHAVTPKKLE